MATFALDEDAHAGRRGDVRDEANVNAFLLEQWALFDVQFDELVKAAAGKCYRFEGASESGLTAQLFEAASLLVAQGDGLLRREHAGHHAAAEASDAKAGRLFGREDDEFNRTTGFEAELLQNANRVEAAEHPNTAVV